jgi:hypothetical protein
VAHFRESLPSQQLTVMISKSWRRCCPQALSDLSGRLAQYGQLREVKARTAF